MNGEEEKALEVIESPPPREADERPPPQQPSLEQPAVDKPEGGEQCGAVEAAANEPGSPADVKSDKDEKLGGGGKENGPAAIDSSSRAERSGEVFGGDEVSVVKGEPFTEDEGKVDEERSEVDGKESKSIEPADSSAGGEKGDEEAVAYKLQKLSSSVARERRESGGEEKARVEEENSDSEEAGKLQEAAHDDETKGGAVGDGEGRAEVKLEESVEEEVSGGKRKLSPVGKNNGELIGDDDAQAVVKDEDELKGEDETACVEELMVDKEEPQKMDNYQYQLHEDRSSSVVAKDDELIREGKEPVKDAEKEAEEDRKPEAEQEKEVGTDEKSGMLAEEEKEVGADEETAMVAEEEIEVAAEEEVEIEREEREVEGLEERNPVKGKEVEVVEETEREVQNERERDAEEETEMEAGEKREVEAEVTEMEAGEDQEVEAGKTELEAREKREVEAEMTEMEAGEDQEVEAEETEMEAGEKRGMEAEMTEMETGEDQEVEDEETEMEAGVDREMEAEETEMKATEEIKLKEEEAEKSETCSGKRKRGRNSKSQAKAGAPRKTIGEDVCFICLDGGDLVLCDRRGCPKAYHPSCVDRDEAFFQSKGRWNCGWHLCSKCGKNAHYMCYTCAFSLCKGCIKEAAFFCVRGNKGLCETCMKTVKQIENNEAGNDEMDQETFNDKSSWEYLFKDYWMEQKAKLSLTLEEIRQARNPWKGSDADARQETPVNTHIAGNEGATGSESSLGNVEATISKTKKSKKRSSSSSKEVDADIEGSPAKLEASGVKRKGRGRLKPQLKEANSDLDNSSKHQDPSASKRRKTKKPSKAHAMEVSSVSQLGSTNERYSMQENTEWASKELLEFVMHMKNGDRSKLSQFDVQELLLQYIKRNRLRDPRRTSQIVCDAMLQRIFGKPRVGHFEMLRLLESHFLLKEDTDENQGSVADTEASQLDADDIAVETGRNRGKKPRKRGNERGLQSNLDDYAAIDMHNINLIFLRRNWMEALMEDMESFPHKVVGSFVRIRISGSSQKQDIYRLVQVLGTTKAGEPYKVSKRIVDVMLEILNLNKTEVILIDKISNQDFTEDECKRLRQSIKCGFISRLTVGDVLEKAKEFQAVRVTDWLETETTRLNHLRDRASEKGRKKELRECVEKLQLLSTPEEKQRRLDEIPEVHADPNMDPGYESEDENETDDRRKEIYLTPRRLQFSRRLRDSFSSHKRDSASTDQESLIAKPASRKWDLTRGLSGKGFSSRVADPFTAGETLNGRSPWNPQVNEVSPYSNSSEKPRITHDSLTGRQVHYSEEITNLSPHVAPENPRSLSAPVAQGDVKINEAEKQWHYRDPSGKAQGPFSVVQLRKWSNNGYFPANLRIWRTGQSEDDSILLTEALAGRFQKEPSHSSVVAGKPYETPLQQQGYRSLTVVKQKVLTNNIASSDRLSPVVGRPTDVSSSKSWAGAASSSVDPSSVSLYDSSALPSSPSTSASATAKVGKVRSESRWSGQPIPDQLPSTATGSTLLQGARDTLPSPTPESNRVSKFSSSPRGLDRSRLMQQSSEEATGGLNKNWEVGRFGSSVHAQRLFSQSTATSLPMSQAPATHHLGQPTANSGSIVSTNTGQGFSNNMVQSPVSMQGWGSSGDYVARPEMVNQNPNNMNPMQAQVQQQPDYGQWVNTAVNNPVAAQPVAYGNYPGQNYAALTPQSQWRPPQQVASSAQPNLQWGPNLGMATPENPSAVPTTMMQGNSNMGWAPQSQSTQLGALAQPTNPAQTPQTMQPVNSNMGWPVAGNMNQGWVANPAGNMNTGSVSAGWNWQQLPQLPPPLPPHYGGAMAAGPTGPQTPKAQRPCPFLMSGRCKKGAACDFSHG